MGGTLFKKAITNDMMIYIILTTADLTEPFHDVIPQ